MFVIILFCVVIGLVLYFKMNEGKKEEGKKQEGEIEREEELPYAKRDILTRYEYWFFAKLKEKCDAKVLIVCPKIRMEDLLIVTAKENAYSWRNRVKSRHVDFVLCDKNMKVLAGIELDDKTHKTEKAKENDDFKDRVFKQIGVPLFRVSAEKGNIEEQIEEIIERFSVS